MFPQPPIRFAQIVLEQPAEQDVECRRMVKMGQMRHFVRHD